MILYYSGTGNTAHVARLLATELETSAELIPTVDPQRFETRDKDLVIAFPVYAWGVPPVVSGFFSRLPENLIERISRGETRLWCVATCGDETGMAVDMFRDTCAGRGAKLSGAWSVIAPNVYVLLPGFDVDKDAVEDLKLDALKPRVKEIARKIKAFKKGDRPIEDVHRGSFPKLKSHLVYPLFLKWGVNTRKWHWTNECISCGKCAEVCPENNIAMVGGHPKWGTNCDSCTACYHVCPVHAVQYGRLTEGKGQYRKGFKLKLRRRSLS